MIVQNMAEGGKRSKSYETSDEAQYKDAVRAMKNGDDNVKTKVALYKLSGLGGVEIDVEGAVELLEERVMKRDSEAKWMLGLCCEYGIGIEQNSDRARMFYLQSCLEGNAVGEFLKERAEGGRGSGIMIAAGKSLKKEVKKKLGDLVCVAPWTALDLSCRF